MRIAPIIRTVEVQAPPARAFELFTRHIGRWWPAGKTVAKTPHVDVLIEPRVGGRWFEVDGEGVETPWGDVLVWDPPGLLVLGWRLNSQWTYDPNFVTEVAVSFAPQGAGTRVVLEHRNLERFGADAEKMAGLLGGGWPTRIDDYVAYVAGHGQA